LPQQDWAESGPVEGAALCWEKEGTSLRGVETLDSAGMQICPVCDSSQAFRSDIVSSTETIHEKAVGISGTNPLTERADKLF
jgi:hypothetical protein